MRVNPGFYYPKQVTIVVNFSDSREGYPTGISSHDNYIYVEKAYDSTEAKKPDRPESFSLSQSYHKGAFILRWTKSVSDGGSSITDYQYQLSYYSETDKRWSPWPDDDSWESAGTDMYELVSGLRSKTKYRVRMRAKNREGPSGITGYKTVTTR